MTKDQFKKAINDRKSQIEDLKRQMMGLQVKYIEEHSEFKSGDLVDVIYPQTHAFNRTQEERRVRCFIGGVDRVLDNGMIEYKFVKQKKDGTMSQQAASIYSTYGARIEKVHATENKSA
jgi:hypothetical protein